MKVKVIDRLFDKENLFASSGQGVAFMARRKAEIISERRRDEPSENLAWTQTLKNYKIVNTLIIDGERSGITLIMEVA